MPGRTLLGADPRHAGSGAQCLSRSLYRTQRRHRFRRAWRRLRRRYRPAWPAPDRCLRRDPLACRRSTRSTNNSRYGSTSCSGAATVTTTPISTRFAKVVQAAGRVIRTQQDEGVVHLIDDRFAVRRCVACCPGGGPCLAVLVVERRSFWLRGPRRLVIVLRRRFPIGALRRSLRPDGEIGIRKGLKILIRKGMRVRPRSGHQTSVGSSNWRRRSPFEYPSCISHQPLKDRLRSIVRTSSPSRLLGVKLRAISASL